MSSQFLGNTHIKEHQKAHIVSASRNQFKDKEKQQRFKDFLLTEGFKEEHFIHKELEQLSSEEEKHIRLALFKLLKQFHKTRPLRSVTSRMEDQQQQQQQQHNPFGSQGNTAITRDELAQLINALLINSNNQPEPVSRVQIPLPPHYDGTHNSFDNKNLIDLSFGGQDSSHNSNVSSATMDHALIPEADIVFLNNLNNSAPGLRLYKAMVGGSDFKILIDSGASTNYVHPKLVSHALTIQDVHNQAVETADASPLQVNDANVVHEVVLDKQETNVDYLLSANQMARYLKKEKITECYVVNFIDQNTGNSASITPINPSLASDLKIDREWKEEFAKLYPYAFKGELTELPPHRATRDIIVTNPVDAPPIYHPPYRMSPLEL
ncbi:hypothetical protein INT47_009298, partial [Mucor saturninus]